MTLMRYSNDTADSSHSARAAFAKPHPMHIYRKQLPLEPSKHVHTMVDMVHMVQCNAILLAMSLCEAQSFKDCIECSGQVSSCHDHRKQCSRDVQ